MYNYVFFSTNSHDYFVGPLSEFFTKHPDAISLYEALCSQMTQQLRDLEELGATPVLPDGKVGTFLTLSL